MVTKPLIPCVGFALIKGGEILVEKRKLTKRIDPGKVCIPSGGIKQGETAETAALREIKEEFGVDAKNPTYIGSLIYETPNADFDMRYFKVSEWTGEIETLEAEELAWAPLSEDSVDIWVDKLMIRAIIDRQKNAP